MSLDTKAKSPPPGLIFSGWAVLGFSLLALSTALARFSPFFGYSYEVIDMPVIWLAGGMALAGLIYFSLLWLIPAAKYLSRPRMHMLLWVVLALGLFMRLVQFASEPALEDDFQRYLWDGAVAANGLNPYAVSPDAAKTANPSISMHGRLATESGQVLDRINHPHLRTIYPPVAQAVFALSYRLGPWSLTAWRGIILVLDLATIALVLLMLRELGRSPLWASLYWWNPIVVKELFNAAHMEAIVIPLVLAGLALLIRKRPLAATSALTLAAGAKLWPVILLPLVWRTMLNTPRKLAFAVSLAALGGILFAWPILSAGLDPESGFVAYASRWKTNSALFPLLETMTGPMAARALIAVTLAAIVAWQCRTPITDSRDAILRALIILTALFLLSPAQFPWYYLWVLPLLCLMPIPGLVVLTGTLPLYYMSFYFLPRGTYESFSQGIVWLIWLPAWSLLLWQGRNKIANLMTSRLRRIA